MTLVLCRLPRSCSSSITCTPSLRSCPQCKRPAFIDCPKPGRVCRKRTKAHSIDWRTFSAMATIGPICVSTLRVCVFRVFHTWVSSWPIWCTSIWPIRTPVDLSRSSAAIRWTIFCVWFRATRDRTIRIYCRLWRRKSIWRRYGT